MGTTEIVYVISPGWGCHLLASLHSLVASGTQFDAVRVICVGTKPDSWVFNDSRVTVDEVGPLHDKDFLINKTYVCHSEADRLVFLDADTLVLAPLDQVWNKTEADFIARIATYGTAKEDVERWTRLLSSLNASDVPYFNSGFFVFQNGTHRAVADYWKEFTLKGLNKELFDPGEIHGPRFAEQISLSLAVGSAHLSFRAMEKREHSFGWASDSFDDAVVYHTGNGAFFSYATKISKAKSFRLHGDAVMNENSPTQRRLNWKLFKQRAKLMVLPGLLHDL
jgi:hypothetical protein